MMTEKRSDGTRDAIGGYNNLVIEASLYGGRDV